MERLKHLKDTLMCCVEGQMGHLETVNTHELGAAIDMLKDLEEAIYYCTITEAMNEPQHEKKHHKYDELYYTEPYYPDERYPYVNSNGWNNVGRWDMNGNEIEHKDGHENGNGKEGRSGRSRRQYMESKEMHHTDSAKQMRELEKYVKELSDDILEMIEEASPEERQFLGKKIAALATKVDAID